jgi:exoribonuclease R
VSGAERPRWRFPAPQVEATGVDRAPAESEFAGPDFDAIRLEFGLPGPFADAALRAAAEAQTSVGLLTRAPSTRYPDRTDLPLETVDPPGSMDLDQAMFLARSDHGGFIVHYAIADVAAFVEPSGPLDIAAQQRVETYYLPDGRTPLHPPILSEGAASLLPGQRRVAALWRIELDGTGEITDVAVQRAIVQSVRKWDYPALQKDIDAGGGGALALLREIGPLRLGLARARGAIALDLPEQIVTPDGGAWTVSLRDDLPVETWNAEISLLTGIAAASLMVKAGVGILRTLPPPEVSAIDHLRRRAQALGVRWDVGEGPGQMLAGLDRMDPRHVALIEQASSLLRGAGYTVVDRSVPLDSDAITHAGVAAPYAHVTAPLRRLVDRYGTEVCLAVSVGAPVPIWAADALTALPGLMAEGDHRSHAADRACVDATEAWVLRDRIGELFNATVVDTGHEGRSATIALAAPAVRATCAGDGLVPGAAIKARLVRADVATRTVRFEVA